MKKTILSLLLAALWSVCAFAQIPMNGLVAHYGFENNFNSSNGHFNLTSANTNGTSSVGFTAGVVGQGAYFDGNSALINNTLSQVLTSSPTQPFSISFWAKRPISGRNNSYATMFEIGGSYFYRFYRNYGYLYEMGYFSNTNQWIGGLPYISNDTLFHHYVITFNPVNNVGGLYIDGSYINFDTSGVVFASPIHLFNNVFTVGGGTLDDATGTLLGSKNMEGIIDEFCVYNRIVSSAEVTQLYNNRQSIAPITLLPTTVSATHSNVLINSADINISALVGNYLNTAVQVKYGTSATNLSNTVAGNNITGLTAQNQVVSVNNLHPNQTYYYKVEVTNVIGTTSSAVQTFKTTAIPPIVYNVSHSDIRDDSATINYTVNPSNAATTVVIKYGTSASNLSNTRTVSTLHTGANPITGAYVLTGLSSYTLYYYQVVATNSSGTSASLVYSFRTLSPTNTPSLPGDYRLGTQPTDNISVYPNPATDVLNVVSEHGIEEIEIINMQGKLLLSGTSSPMNISYLPSGLYIVRVTDEKGKVSTLKFNKQ